MSEQMTEPGDNPDLTAERQSATFNVREMAQFLYGGVANVRRRDEIARFVEAAPDLQDPKPLEFMSREERLENAARKVVAMTKHADIIDVSNVDEAAYYQNLVMARDHHPLGLHYIMFVPTLQGQMNNEQQEKWLPMAATRAIIGTYAQTELGHGTNLRKLETTATYDPSTEEFILHTPRVTGAKWWPGSLGKSANFAVVVAQLWSAGKCYGPHSFIVQLRDTDTHKPLPGIKVGDIGPKLGFASNDNGFLIFDQFRIPRENMLMRYAQILPNGHYVKPSHAKLGYGTMVFVRSAMIRDQALHLGTAATIAIRYSTVRRQGEMVEGEGEVKVLDYQTQQYRLLPALAKAYVFFLAGNSMRQTYLSVVEQVKSGDVRLLPELHALSSGLKAVVTFEVSKGVEQCRQACGGHGYSQASGLPELYTETVAGCTYEGDNIVLLLQVARFLIKAGRQVRAGESNLLAAIAEYLGRVGPSTSALDQSPKINETVIINAFEHMARRKVFGAIDRLEMLTGRGLGPEMAWNQTAVHLCKASRSHVRVYLVKTFLHTVQQVNNQSLKQVLNDVARLFVFDSLMQCKGDLLEDGYMSAQQIAYIRLGIYDCLSKLRKNAVALVDSFQFRDRELRSILGRRDGRVYENLLRWAEQSQLNKQDVLPSFEKYLGPMMKEARSKL